MLVILTHDVDWPRKGPGVAHILARRERFDEEVIRRVLREGFNPYFGIPEIMEAEERLGLRSTFFFRPFYDDGTRVDQYEDVIKELTRGGWEVGLHTNDVTSVESVRGEKEALERIAGEGVIGCRVHYLRMDLGNLWVLKKAGFLYDSSIVFTKDRLDPRNAGIFEVDGLVEFPVTFMDAYMFTYMKLKEEDVVPFVTKALDDLRRQGVKVATILWHDSSIRMRGGRAYPWLLEHLASMDGIKLVRGVDALREYRQKGF